VAWDTVTAPADPLIVTAPAVPFTVALTVLPPVTARVLVDPVLAAVTSVVAAAVSAVAPVLVVVNVVRPVKPETSAVTPAPDEIDAISIFLTAAEAGTETAAISTIFKVSVPPPPSSESSAVSVCVPVAAEKVSAALPPVKLSTPVVSDLLSQFDNTLMFKIF
jgi:hypothetical protein